MSGSYLPDSTPTGALLSTLNADEARRFAALADAFCDGQITMHIRDDNTIQLTTTETDNHK